MGEEEVEAGGSIHAGRAGDIRIRDNSQRSADLGRMGTGSRPLAAVERVGRQDSSGSRCTW